MTMFNTFFSDLREISCSVEKRLEIAQRRFQCDDDASSKLKMSLQLFDNMSKKQKEFEVRKHVCI